MRLVPKTPKKRCRDEAPEPRQSREVNIGLGLDNEHVYKYWRWLGWVNSQVQRLFASELCYDLARQEHTRQEAKAYTPKNKR